MVKVPFLDLRVLDSEERQEILDAVDGVLQHGHIILGPEVQDLETRVSSYIGRKHALGVNSGTDALVLSIRALGLGPGDEVITTPLSFIATANAISLSGATPVFADIDETLCLDPDSIEALITAKTKAILPVHWAGKICRMDEITAIADKHGLMVVEDCSQAFGATYKGRKSGSFGTVACYSMNSMKAFASIGEAGMIATDDDGLAERIDALRYNGLINREQCAYVSHNGRLDTIQAAVLLKRFEHYEALLARRKTIAQHYDRELAEFVNIPKAAPDCVDIYYTYTIQTDRRDELQVFLSENDIETKVQHIPMMPDQPIYKNHKRNCPNAERLIQTVLCLPVSEKVTDEQMEFVTAKIREFFGASA